MTLLGRYLALFLNGPCDDADVGDAGLLDRVHHRSERAEGDALISAQVNDTLRRISLSRRAESCWQVVDVHRLVLQEDVLIAVDGDDHALLSYLVDAARL